MRFIRIFSVEEKLKVIQVILKYNMKYCLETVKIHRSMIYRWWKQRDLLLQQPLKCKKIGTGRKPTLIPSIEREIAAWVQERNDTDLQVNAIIVREYCLSKYGDIFSFSKDWFRRFRDRFNLKVRRVTSFSHRPKGRGESRL